MSSFAGVYQNPGPLSRPIFGVFRNQQAGEVAAGFIVLEGPALIELDGTSACRINLVACVIGG